MAENERPVREIAANRRARRDYEILDRLEVGVALVGTEVKTLRSGHVSIAEAYVRVTDDEMWLEGAHIDEYREGNRHNHEATRRRRLLARKREIRRWGQRMKEKGLTIVALRLYFRGRHAKLEIGLARGRKRHDKREQLRERDAKREMRNLRRR